MQEARSRWTRFSNPYPERCHNGAVAILEHRRFAAPHPGRHQRCPTMHTMASHAAMNGVPVPVVSRLLGHSNVRMTLRYAHLAGP